MIKYVFLQKSKVVRITLEERKEGKESIFFMWFNWYSKSPSFVWFSAQPKNRRYKVFTIMRENLCLCSKINYCILKLPRSVPYNRLYIFRPSLTSFVQLSQSHLAIPPWCDNFQTRWIRQELWLENICSVTRRRFGDRSFWLVQRVPHANFCVVRARG